MEENRPITSIVPVQLPKKLDYFVGETALDLAGGEICAICEDGSFQIVPMEDDAVSVAFQSGQEGPTLATATYKEKTLLFQIHIREPIIRKFIVVRPLNKKEYLAGERLDLSGLLLDAEYESGERARWERIPDVEYQVQEGDAVYPLTISGITVPIYIKVKAAKLVAIRIGKLPTKTEYLERKENLSVAGATIIHVYDSGAEEEVAMPYPAVRGFSNLKPGSQTLTVQIGALTTSFEITIKEKTATQLVVLSSPHKLTYIEGECIEMDGLKLSAEYDNGETRLVEAYDYEPKAASLKETAIRLIVGKIQKEIAIGVMPRQLTGIAVSRPPVKTKYLERKEALEVAGAELELTFNSGPPEHCAITDSMVHGFDNRQEGECKLEVQHEGYIANFSVEITPQQLMGLFISKLPEKTEYAPGELFEKKGLQVSGFYNNGLMQAIDAYVLTPDRPLEKQDVAIVVMSLDKSAVIPIQVSEEFCKEIVPPIESGEESSTATADEAKDLIAATLVNPVSQAKENQAVEPTEASPPPRRTFYPSSSKLRELHD